MITYSEIKTAVQTLYGESIGSGSFIESDSGNPTELAMLLDFIHNRITGYPNEWSFTTEETTIPVTGATSYDLKTLVPGFLSLIQVYGINSNEQHQFHSARQANITSFDGYTIKNGILTFTGQLPQSSTFKILFNTQYLVKDSSGTRKRFFTESDDESVLNYADFNVLIFGVGVYANWKVDEVSKEKRNEIKDWFKEAWTNMLLRTENTHPLDSML